MLLWFNNMEVTGDLRQSYFGGMRVESDWSGKRRNWEIKSQRQWILRPLIKSGSEVKERDEGVDRGWLWGCVTIILKREQLKHVFIQ